jgi:hypothetical protein
VEGDETTHIKQDIRRNPRVYTTHTVINLSTPEMCQRKINDENSPKLGEECAMIDDFLPGGCV